MKSRYSFLTAVLGYLVLLGGCAASMPDKTAAPAGKLSCGGFFVYEMCAQDLYGRGEVDFLYFADTSEIFMYRKGADLSAVRPLTLHRCAMQMPEDTLLYSTQLLYGEQLTLLEEMDVKSKLLFSYLAAKEQVDECYGGDSSLGDATGATEDFLVDDYDWDDI